VTSDTRQIALTYDAQGRLTSVTADSRRADVLYMDELNAIRMTDGQKTVDWRFGPGRKPIGVVVGNQATLWTRSPEGRIIQVAFGHLEDGSADGFKKFTVDDTIGTTTSPTGAASQ